MVGASLEVMDPRTRGKMRGVRPFVFSNLKSGPGAWRDIIAFIEREGLMK